MEKIIARIVIFGFILVALYGIVDSIFFQMKSRIYTAAIVYEKGPLGKNGRTYYFKYYIKNKEYKGSTKGLIGGTTNKNGLLYVEVLENNYEKYKVLEFNKVPDCLKIADVPINGWEEIPASSVCNEQ